MALALIEFALMSPRRRGWSNIALALIVAVAALVLSAAGLVILNVARGVTGRSILPNAGAAPTAVVSISTNAASKTWAAGQRTNILILGIDQRPGEDPRYTRTDTMILATLDPATKSAGMMSIPRDLWVPMPNKNLSERINVAHVFGGPSYSMETVTFNFGIPVQHYVRVNFMALQKIVDELGGIDVFVEQDISDPQFPDSNYGYDPFYIKAGWQHMNGVTAMKYARTRHGSSDFARMKRQQQVIMAIREKATSIEGAARIVTRIPQLFQILSDSIDTDLALSDVVSMAAFAKDLQPDQLSRVVIDETAVQAWNAPGGQSVLIPVRERVEQLRDALYSPQTKAAVSVPIEPGKVAIQNGTPTTGLGANAQALLQKKGFTVTKVDNAQKPQAKSVIIDYHGRQEFSRQLAQALGLPLTAVQTQLDSKNSLDALIVLGDDFKLP